MNIKDLILLNFPTLKAIGVTTRVNLNYLLNIEITMAWVLNYYKALDYKKIIVIGLEPNDNAPYFSPLNGIQYTGLINQRGNYFIADIVCIKSVEMVKNELTKMRDHENHLGIHSTFHDTHINQIKRGDKRLVFQFNSKNVELRSLEHSFVGLSNPAFYIR